MCVLRTTVTSSKTHYKIRSFFINFNDFYKKRKENVGGDGSRSNIPTSSV